MKEEVISKVIEKNEFSELPSVDLEMVYEKFDKDRYCYEDRVKLMRNFLRKSFSGFGGQKLLKWKDREANEVLEKHLSTRERFKHYEEIYFRLLKNMPKKISVIDLGCGVNGFSYGFFEKVGKEVDYVGVEAVGQLVSLMNEFFAKKKIKAKAIHESLFDFSNIKKIIEKKKNPRVVFMFKVIDALESLERDYTKKFLKEIKNSADLFVVSFPTESWFKRKRFFVQRTWLINFLREEFEFRDDFNLGGERYLVFVSKSSIENNK